MFFFGGGAVKCSSLLKLHHYLFFEWFMVLYSYIVQIIMQLLHYLFYFPSFSFSNSTLSTLVICVLSARPQNEKYPFSRQRKCPCIAQE